MTWAAKGGKAEVFDKSSTILNLTYRFKIDINQIEEDEDEQVYQKKEVKEEDENKSKIERMIKERKITDKKLIKEFRDACNFFNIIDKEGNGAISWEEIEPGMQYLGVSDRNPQVKKEIQKLMVESNARKNGELNMDEWLVFCDKVKPQKEKWEGYEKCYDLIDATKGNLDNIWHNAPKNSKNAAPWDTFLPCFWYGLGVSNDRDITSNGHYIECLKSLFDVKDGTVLEDRYKVFSRIYSALFPTNPNITTGNLFLKSILELYQQRYFVGYMDSRTSAKILDANSDDSFLLRISYSFTPMTDKSPAKYPGFCLQKERAQRISC